jgi:hypothetical protein
MNRAKFRAMLGLRQGLGKVRFRVQVNVSDSVIART